tara:strand:+ start:998 stop:1132 length:135 start_codon:yes stop_codon:yes gene_type:complete
MPKISLNDLKNDLRKTEKRSNIFGVIAIAALVLSTALATGYLPL